MSVSIDDMSLVPPPSAENTEATPLDPTIQSISTLSYLDVLRSWVFLDVADRCDDKVLIAKPRKNRNPAMNKAG